MSQPRSHDERPVAVACGSLHGSALGLRIWKASLPFVTGGTATAAATLCTHPIDVLKVHLQLHGQGGGGGDMPRPTTWALARRIITSGHVRYLYSGLSAALLRQAVYGTSRLGFFFSIENAFKARAAQRGGEIGFGQRAVAGISAGAMAAAIGNPTEVALVRMQSDSLRPLAMRAHYRSVFDALARIVRNEGVAGLYSGLTPTVVRAMATNFGQLAIYSEAKHQLHLHARLSHTVEVVVGSTFAGVVAAIFCAPFDFVKTRLQTHGVSASHVGPTYTGPIDCFRKVIRDEGFPRLYRGFGPFVLRVAPHT